MSSSSFPGCEEGCEEASKDGNDESSLHILQFQQMDKFHIFYICQNLSVRIGLGQIIDHCHGSRVVVT